MVDAATSPLLIRDAVVSIGVGAETPGDFACEVRRVELVPTPGTEVRYRTLCPDGTYVELGASTWALVLAGPQDWKAGGLARLLFDHEGEELSVTVDAFGADHVATNAEPAFTCRVRAVPVTYGGEVDTFAEYEIELPVIGKPELTPVVAP